MAARMLLVVSLLAPLAGPFLVQALRRSKWLDGALDAFVIVLLGGLLATHILPDSLTLLGWPAVLALLLGLALPKALHAHDHASPSGWVYVLSSVALSVHALVDGAALGSDRLAASNDSLVLAMGLHRLLEGMGTWWLLARYVALPARAALMLGLAGTTVLGYALAHLAVQAGLALAAALLQVGVAGSLLHVLLWHPSADEAACSMPRSRPPSPGLRLASLMGAGAAVLALYVFERSHAAGAHGHHAASAARGLGHQALRFALPSILAAALVALGCAAVAHAIGTRWQLWPLGRRPLSQALLGAVRGLFVPACSCGVVSLAAARRAEGMAPPGALAYLLCAPAMGWVGFVVSVTLLGPVLTIWRALGIVGLASCQAWLLAPRRPTLPQQAPGARKQLVGGHGAASWTSRLGDGVQFVGGEMLDFTAPWLGFGLALVALLMDHVPAQWLSGPAEAGWDVVLLAAVASPVYLCAAAATLVGWFCWQAGASTGAVLTFVWLASSLSLASAAAQARWHGRGRAAATLLAQWLSAVALGLGVNAMCDASAWASLAVWPPTFFASDAQGGTVWLAVAGSLGAFALWRQGVRGFVGQLLWANGPQTASAHHHLAAGGGSGGCGHLAAPPA